MGLQRIIIKWESYLDLVTKYCPNEKGLFRSDTTFLGVVLEYIGTNQHYDEDLLKEGLNKTFSDIMHSVADKWIQKVIF